MKVLAILVLVGFASSEWISEMENENPQGIGEMTPDQVRYVGGDMLMTGYEEEDLISGVAYTSTKRVWPKSGKYVTIPYENTISSSTAKSRIQEAIDDYYKYTCIRFRKKTASDTKGYLSFYQGGGCSSPVGYYGRKNSISLASGCWRKGTIMHEIAHSLGIYHEQSRKDRDDHVEIVWVNIPASKSRNFNKYTQYDSHGTDYDYESMMHYGKTAFGGGKITIRTKDSRYENVIGQRTKMSTIDKKQINAMYKCSSDSIGTGGGGSSGGSGGGSSGTCRDVATEASCKYWVGKGYCKTGSRYKSYMTKNCAKSCTFCKPKPVCQDQNKGCPGWTKFCTTSQYVIFMKMNCAKTCKFC